MKKFKTMCLGLVVSFLCLTMMAQPVHAAEGDTILAGVYADDISLGGMTAEEAKDMMDQKIAEWSGRQITLIAVGGNEVQITPADVGFHWNNPEVIDEAASIGQHGNIVQRYKVSRDLQHENRVLPLKFSCDEELLRLVLADQCSVYNHEASDATLTRENDAFIVNPGQNGEKVDEDASM